MKKLSVKLLSSLAIIMLLVVTGCQNKDTKEEFSYTSYLYNYIWYGEFDIDDAQFEKAKKAFTQFLRTLWK